MPRVTCPNCKITRQVTAEKLQRASGSFVRCTACKHRYMIDNAAEPSEPEQTTFSLLAESAPTDVQLLPDPTTSTPISFELPVEQPSPKPQQTTSKKALPEENGWTILWDILTAIFNTVVAVIAVIVVICICIFAGKNPAFGLGLLVFIGMTLTWLMINISNVLNRIHETLKRQRV